MSLRRQVAKGWERQPPYSRGGIAGLVEGLEQAHRRLQYLYEISKLLIRFGGVEQTIPRIIAVVAKALPLRSAILILATGDGFQILAWQPEGESAESLRQAETRARASYRYLAGLSPPSVDLSSVQIGTLELLTPSPHSQTEESHDRKNFIFLPLVIEGQPIFGALQLEGALRLDEMDLLFIDAVVNQIALALDRQAAIDEKYVLLEKGRARAEEQKEAAETKEIDAEQRQASAEALQERYESLVDNLNHTFVWEADASTLQVSYVSAHAEMLLGYPRQQWREQPDFWMKHLHPEDRQFVEQVFDRVLRDGKDEQCDHRCLTADGRVLWLHTGIHLPKSDTGSPEYQCVSMDITPLKEAQEQAQKAICARESLLAVVSHDLRTPLTSIYINSDALLRSLSADEKHRRKAETIRRSAARMNYLISDVLDTASIDVGHLSLNKQRHAVTPLVHEALEMQQALAERKSLQLESKLPSSRLDVICDLERTLRVLSNLIGNAVKFTLKGGITVRVEPRGHEACFTVADTGPGISQEDLPHVFERFWQAKKTASLGTGLGLSIAKGIVEALDGKMWVESQLGMGTTFFFTLPLADSSNRAGVQVD